MERIRGFICFTFVGVKHGPLAEFNYMKFIVTICTMFFVIEYQ